MSHYALKALLRRQKRGFKPPLKPSETGCYTILDEHGGDVVVYQLRSTTNGGIQTYLHDGLSGTQRLVDALLRTLPGTETPIVSVDDKACIEGHRRVDRTAIPILDDDIKAARAAFAAERGQTADLFEAQVDAIKEASRPRDAAKVADAMQKKKGDK